MTAVGGPAACPPDWYSRMNTLGTHSLTSEGWTAEFIVGL